MWSESVVGMTDKASESACPSKGRSCPSLHFELLSDANLSILNLVIVVIGRGGRKHSGLLTLLYLTAWGPQLHKSTDFSISGT